MSKAISTDSSIRCGRSMTERFTLPVACLLAALLQASCAPARYPQPPRLPAQNAPGVDALHAHNPLEQRNYPPKDAPDLVEEKQQPHPLDRRISFSFLGATLGEAVGTLSKLTDIGVTVLSDHDARKPLHTRRVSLTMQNARLADALDWIMRQVDARYTWDGSGIRVFRGNGNRFPGELVSRVYPLRTIKRFDTPVPGFENIEAEKEKTFQCIKDLLAEYLSGRPGSDLVLTPQREGFVALCSEAAHRRIAETMREMARGKEKTPPLGPVHDAGEIEKKLQQVIFCAYRDRPVLEVLSRLSVESGVSIGIDPRELAQREKTKITLHYGKASLEYTLKTIVKLCRLQGYEVEPGRGVWLHGRRAYPAEGRSLWETGIIRSYYVEPSVEKIGLAKLMDLVKQNVTPDRWGNALPAMAYAPSGRLVVFHSRAAHIRLASYLNILERAIAAGQITKPDEE